MTSVKNLRQATLSSHAKALVFVENELKPPFIYLVQLNQSLSMEIRWQMESVILASEIRAKAIENQSGLLAHDEVAVTLLWRDGLVPGVGGRIIPVGSRTASGLSFQLTCCAGRFAENEPLLYHSKEGYPLLSGAPGVWTPPGWKSLDDTGRFDVNWHLKRKKD